MAEKRLNGFVTAVLVGCFLSFRWIYWGAVQELPFSDMADYLAIAKRVLCCFDFSHSEFWQSYKPPTLPLLGAGVLALSGDDFLIGWRLFLALFTLSSLLWACSELNRSLGSSLYGLALLAVVTFSRSSIFWSLKFSTEGVSEAFTYLIIALILFSQRQEKRPGLWWSILGGVVAAATLNRPNVVMLVPVLPLLIVFYRQLEVGFRTAAKHAALFVVGAVVVWIPWLVRGYQLYGHIVPLSTQGPYSFLWELGSITAIDQENASVTKDVSMLQREAPGMFPNDYEASQYARLFMRSWLRGPAITELAPIIERRAKQTIEGREIALSHVSRATLSPPALDRLLIDKIPFLVTSGFLGLFFLSIVFPRRLYFLPSVAILPVLFSIVFLGDPRFLEPSLPLILFGNLGLILWIALFVLRRAKKNVG